MPEATSTRPVSVAEGYRLWSRVYDEQPNPMLSLERRYVEALLSSVAGHDVVDLGCGTGRWLAQLAAHNPPAASLTGVDASPEMLARASEKLAGRAILRCADCCNSKLPAASADFILCSFLASYVPSLDALAAEIARITRADADVFVTDLHPTTEAALGWRRGFRIGEAHVDLETHSWSLDEIRSSFERAGLELVAIIEPPFGAPEFEILRAAGKTTSAASAALQNLPAIYIMQFRRAGKLRAAISQNHGVEPRTFSHVSGARIALGPQESANAAITIEHGRIQFISTAHRDAAHAPGAPHDKPLASRAPERAIDLAGYLVLPGLVNAHDHLEFALFPRLGKGGYNNFVEWADDIHRPDSSPVREQRAVPKSARLWWGAIRNLLAGVTTVCHHNPYQPEVFDRDFPVRVLRDFSWAHSLAMDSGSGVAAKYAAAPADQPFILHLGEGVDARSSAEFFALQNAGALTGRTVLVHGLALDATPGRGAASLLNESGASLVWCPSSNQFLFGRTHSREFIRSLDRVALGSDSSLTAQGDLLDELRFAHNSVGVPAGDLFAQVTTASASILRLNAGEGSLRVGAPADFFAVRDTGVSAADTLANISYADVELVVVAGRVHLASDELRSKLPPVAADGLERLEIGGIVRWLRAPVKDLLAHAAQFLGPDVSLNGRQLRE